MRFTVSSGCLLRAIGLPLHHVTYQRYVSYAPPMEKARKKFAARPGQHHTGAHASKRSERTGASTHEHLPCCTIRRAPPPLSRQPGRRHPREPAEPALDRVLGGIHGIEGVLADQLYDLTDLFRARPWELLRADAPRRRWHVPLQAERETRPIPPPRPT